MSNSAAAAFGSVLLQVRRSLRMEPSVWLSTGPIALPTKTTPSVVYMHTCIPSEENAKRKSNNDRGLQPLHASLAHVRVVSDRRVVLYSGGCWGWGCMHGT